MSIYHHQPWEGFQAGRVCHEKDRIDVEIKEFWLTKKEKRITGTKNLV